MSMTNRDLKDQLHEQFARVGKALASPKRLEILDLLAQGEKPVEAIAEQTAVTIKNASAHLRELRGARLVETRKERTYVFYRLAGERVFQVLREIQALARERLREVDHVARLYFEARDEMEPIGAEELHRRMRDGAVTILDVRPEDEYRAGHIEGAISVPVRDLERRIADLPGDREIIAYCRGPYCVYAAEAVETLRKVGLRARRMEEGLPDWKARGFPVETGVPA
jgi:rhodanese-related sulfurtransferase/DNA-binding transcriptional ArsR family regulator